jgi:glyoxylase-like metal-dependent hydrolase (beta-lactamase superfamily II)
VDALRISVPTPFAPWQVNGYLFGSAPVTIVDPGPALQTTRGTWSGLLDSAGLRPSDVEQILLTHEHWDHIGAAAEMREWTGARLVAPAGVHPFLSDFKDAIGEEVRYYERLMDAHGVPPQLTAQALAIFAAIPRFVEPAELDTALGAGDDLEIGDYRLTVCPRPGHSHTDTVFVTDDTRSALVGDHLLSEHPPIVMPLSDGRVPRGPGLLRSGLPRMYESLRKTADLHLELALAGHGAPILAVADVIDHARLYYRRHDDFVISALRAGPASAWELTLQRDGGSVRGENALYKLGSTLGSLEMLALEDRVIVEAPDEGIPRFRLAK